MKLNILNIKYQTEPRDLWQSAPSSETTFSGRWSSKWAVRDCLSPRRHWKHFHPFSQFRHHTKVHRSEDNGEIFIFKNHFQELSGEYQWTNHRRLLTAATMSRATRARMSEQETLPGHAFSSAAFTLSMTSKPRRLKFGDATFSGMFLASFRRTEPSQPYTEMAIYFS